MEIGMQFLILPEIFVQFNEELLLHLPLQIRLLCLQTHASLLHDRQHTCKCHWHHVWLIRVEFNQL